MKLDSPLLLDMGGDLGRESFVGDPARILAGSNAVREGCSCACAYSGSSFTFFFSLSLPLSPKLNTGTRPPLNAKSNPSNFRATALRGLSAPSYGSCTSLSSSGICNLGVEVGDELEDIYV